MVAVVVLHTGPYKTGTTALQRALSAQSDLLARNGILYPTSGRYGVSHAPLGEALLRGDMSVLADLARETRECRVVLISTEHLCGLDAPGLVALRDVFPGAEFRVSYALRRLAGLWPSHWTELLKHGQHLGFDHYLRNVERRDETPFSAPILPRLQIDRLAEVFGIAALRLGVYDARLAEGQDIGPAFIDDMFGLGHIASGFATDRTNLSPPRTETAMHYLLNVHAGPKVDHRTKRRAHKSLFDHFRDDPPPPWLAPLRSAVDEAGYIDFGSDHPLVVAEETAVAENYGASLLDDARFLAAPLRTAVLKVESLRLSPAGSGLLTAAFDAALAGARPD